MNQTELEALLNKQIGGNLYNVVLGVQSKDGKIDLAAAAGQADPQSNAPMTPDTPYYLASIAKLYTTTVILKLVEQGLIDLDAAIATYLPDSLLDGIHTYQGKDYSRQLKVHHLLSHTSGLADYFEDKSKGGQSVLDKLKEGQDIAVDVESALAIVRTLPPKFEPGARNGRKASYSDTNFQLLRAIIEAVTGKTIEENFEEKIFRPLGLQCTYAFGSEEMRSEHPPAALYLKDKPVHAPIFFATSPADGGVVSTVAESLIFLRAFFEGQLFDPAFFERMTARWNRIFFPMQYGYGMMRFKLPRFFSPLRPIPELIGHSGSTGSFAYYCPAKALYLAGTVNQLAAPSKPFTLMIQIINKFR